MNCFAELLDRLGYESGRNAKLRLITGYLRDTPDPERGWDLAALTGELTFKYGKVGMIHVLIAERADPVLFALSYDHVGDLSETVALMWPSDSLRHPSVPPSLSDVVETLSTLGKAQLPAQIARWLDGLDETGRWALLKLVTGALRIGVSARLAKTAVASLGKRDSDEIEILWPGLTPPYLDLFAWLEGRADKPSTRDPAPFRPAMLAHAAEESDLTALNAADYLAEWKWDGIRVQAVAGSDEHGELVARLYSRTGEEISRSFPDLLAALRLPCAIDGELLIMREARVQSFNVLQQRLNRKSVTVKLMEEFPAHLRAYDLLAEGDEDLRNHTFSDRRERLQTLITGLNDPRIDISPLVPFKTWSDLTAARADPASAGAGADAEAVEGVMVKRRDAAYVPGRPKGAWGKGTRDHR